MSGIKQDVLFYVSRIKSEFTDDIGNIKKALGTGFWVISKNGNNLFITNKHNIDPTLKLGYSTKFRLTNVELELRKQNPSAGYQNETKFCGFFGFPEKYLHDDADCVVIKVGPMLNADGYGIIGFAEKDIADEAFLKKKVSAMDITSFIGFPNDWYDKHWNMGIARNSYIASWPSMSFKHKDIKTSHIVLMSGFSFAGSSGSPVILHEKGSPIFGAGLPNPNYTPPRLIGIMSGHWRESSEQSEIEKHSGLSYMTQSTAIHEILQKHEL